MVVIVVALEDCTISVTTAPQKAPDSGVAATLLSTVRSLDPASPLRPAVMTLMPSRNRPTPPRTETVVDMRAPSRVQRQSASQRQRGCNTGAGPHPGTCRSGRFLAEAAARQETSRTAKKQSISDAACCLRLHQPYPAVFMTKGLPPPGPLLIHTLLVWRYPSIASMPFSRPRPEALYPPNGIIKLTAR